MDSLVKKVSDFVISQYCDIATGHDWYHIDRVRKNALHIQSKEGGDKLVIELAALLHDISDYKFNGGDDKLGGMVSYKAIIDCGGTEELARQISEIVDSISYKGADVEDTTNSLEAKIVQDGDRLDALGAIGIARTFAYGGKNGSPIYDPTVPYELHDSFEKYKNSKSTSINHFYEKLLLLPNKMHTSTAKKIAEERISFMKNFLAHFYNEWESKYSYE